MLTQENSRIQFTFNNFIKSKNRENFHHFKFKFAQLDNKWRFSAHSKESGKIGWILLWILGIPLPILVILFILRGCT